MNPNCPEKKLLIISKLSTGIFGVIIILLELLGLLICGIFAATLTTMDAGLNQGAGIFVRNFYLPIKDERVRGGRTVSRADCDNEREQ